MLRSTCRFSTVPPVLVLRARPAFVIAGRDRPVVPSIIAFSGYVLAMLYKDHSLVWPAMLLAVGAGAMVVDQQAHRRLRRRAIDHHHARDAGFFWGGIAPGDLEWHLV